MKATLAIILTAAAVSFYLGWRSTPPAPEEGGPASSGRVSALSKSDSVGPQSVRQLLRGRPTKKRALAIQLAILRMDAAELGALWESELANLDFNNGDDRLIINAILNRLGELDPLLAAEKLAQTGSDRWRFVAAMARGWGGVDQAAAVDWCNQQSYRVRRNGLEGVLDGLEGDDAIGLYINLVKEKHLKSGEWHSRTFLARWVQRDPQAALAAGQRINAELGNRWPFLYALEAYGRSGGSEAARWLEANSENPGMGYSFLINGWSEADPEAAANFAIGLQQHDVFDSCMLQVLDNWAQSDFGAVSRWVDAVGDAGLRQELQRTLVGQARGYTDHEPALEYALSRLESNPGMFATLLGVTESMATRDPAAAMAWAGENLTDPEQQKKFRDRVLDQISWALPAESAPFVEAMRGDHPERDDHHRRTAHLWAINDLAAAREWVDQLPAGSTRDAATAGLASGWMADRSRRAQADEWVEGYFGGPLNDPIADRYARGLMDHKAIEDSIAAAQRIEDPMLRDHTMEDILKVWIRDEIKAEDARAFTESTDLISETARWRVLNRKYGHE